MQPCRLVILGIASLTLTIYCAQLKAGDWPWFLGPQHTGVSTETGLLPVWPESGPPIVWRRDIGTGYSAPSVLGDRLVLHHRPADEEVVECLDVNTGDSIWTYSYPSQFKDPYGYNNGPRCSPVLTADYCYTLGAEGRLSCLTLTDGQLVWEHKLRDEFQIPDGFFGVGCSPVLDGDRLIVLVGGQPNSGVVAFDAKTGQTQWAAVGKQTWDGVVDESGDACEWSGDEMVVSYSSPIVATIHGRRHLLCLVRQGLVSLDPATGEENFKYWFRASVHESVNAARPVVVGDTVMISAAYRTGAACLRVQPDGKGCEAIWRDARNLLTHWSTAIAIDGYYYGFSGRHEQEGELRCIDARDGAVVWKTTGWDKPLTSLGQNTATGEVVDRETGQVVPWPFYGRGSATLVDGKFIVLGERGTLALGKPSPDGWEEISRCKAPEITYPAWTAPVLSNGRLYLRDEDTLICLDLRVN
ncbi:MAG: PQQ-like beta-propeller repeat protein [Planctomycetaceae bacterium]|nr:PQQ-like beta-propeller repeat protein [Planctomycetaceae bacterium]